MNISAHCKMLLGFMLLFTLVVSACKKDTPTKVLNNLSGYWYVAMPDESSDEKYSTLTFSSDSIYFSTWDHKSDLMTIAKGTFRATGVTLITNFKEVELRKINYSFISKSPVADTYFKNATYQKTEEKLIINYSGSPSKGNKYATMILKRMIFEYQHTKKGNR